MNSFETQWLPINPRDYSMWSAEKTANGAEYQMGINPFDIPEQVRSIYNHELHRFIVEFTYWNQEKQLVDLELSPVYTLIVGRESGRIHAIVINGDELERANDRSHIEEYLLDALTMLKDLSNAQLKRRPTKNYQFARKVVEGKSKELFSQLTFG